jgi:hypothetical protein
MRIHDLLTENRLDEKPMGFLKTIGNKAMAAFGSGKAAGKLETGTMANQLRKEYDTYLGRSGEEATADNLLAFLKSKNLPTDGAARALKAQAPQGAIGGAVKGLAKGVADVGKAAVAGAKAGTAAGPAAPANEPQQKVEPTLAPKSDSPKQSFGQGTAMPIKPLATPGAGTDPNPAKPAAVQSAGRPQGGGKIAGQYSQTPGAQAKKAKRATAAAQRTADADRFNKAIVQPLTKKESLEEALSSSHIDAAITAAAQDAAKQGITPAAGGGTTNKLGAVGAAAKAVGGATVDAAKAFNANFQAAYKGKKTGTDDEPDDGATAGFNAGLKDESGTVPEDLMKRLNTLKNKQRQELLKLLG